MIRSSGGVVGLAEAADHPALVLVSGPAGGVAGAALLARLAGVENAISLDMGGTSTDVCLIAGGEAARSSERVGGRAADPAAAGRRPHGRRRRRLARLA